MECSAVDLFCGIGGLTHGLEAAGVPVIAGFDVEGSCKFAYEHNNKACFIEKDITQLTGEELAAYYPKDHVKILVGCAPCQPFSTYSFRYNKNGKKNNKWKLLYCFADLIESALPEVVSMENVPQLCREEVFAYFLTKLKELNYHCNYKIVNCAEYGVPQNRKRLVLLASRLGEISLIPALFNVSNFRTVRDAIGGLPKINDGFRDPDDPLHCANKLSELNKRRIMQSKPGGTWKDWDDNLKLACHKRSSGKSYLGVYGRMEWDKPSPTITTKYYGYGNGRFGHPEQNRAISMREGALLQSFPPNYRFIDPNNFEASRKIGVHIGNAVPVELGRAIGISILQHLKKWRG